MRFCWISHYPSFASLSNEKQVLKWWLRKHRCVYLLYKLTLKKFVLFLSQKRPCAGMCFSCCQGTPLPSSTSRAHCRFCGQNGAGELQGGDGNATTSRCTKLACFYLLTCKVISHFPGSCCSDSVCRGMWSGEDIPQDITPACARSPISPSRGVGHSSAAAESSLTSSSFSSSFAFLGFFFVCFYNLS